MKIRIFWLIGLLIFANGIFSQPTINPRNHSENRFHQIGWKFLELDSTQRVTFHKLNQELRHNLHTLKTEAEAFSTETFCSELEKHHQSVLKILNEEQATKFSEILQKIEERQLAAKEKMGIRKELAAELQSYRKEHIHPVMQDLRNQLEQKISQDDSQTLAELRSKMELSKEARTDMKKEKPELDCFPLAMVYLSRGRPSADKSRSTRMQKKHAGEWKSEAFFQDRKTLLDLANKYQPDIKELFASLDGKQAQWQEDMKAIKDKYQSDFGEKLQNRPFQGRQERRSKAQGRRSHPDKAKSSEKPTYETRVKSLKYQKFLLMKPVIQMEIERDGNASTLLKVYPSPAEYAHKIDYTVSKAGQIQIRLMDRSGRLLKTIVDEYLQPGKYSKEIDFQNLNDVIYFYSVKDADGISSVKFVKSN